MGKIKRLAVGLIAAAAAFGSGAVTAGVANAESCSYHTRMMFGNYIIDGYAQGPQQATQAAYAKAKAKGISTVGGKRMWTQYECR